MTVLLVEDDASIALVVNAALEAEGFTVTCCDSIAERDRLLAANRYELLLTDVMLTDGDGLETLGTVPFIFNLGHDDRAAIWCKH